MTRACDRFRYLVASQNLADGGGRDPVAQAPQLTLDTGVAPRRILAGQVKNQAARRRRDPALLQDPADRSLADAVAQSAK